jgi:hypothetical protein
MRRVHRQLRRSEGPIWGQTRKSSMRAYVLRLTPETDMAVAPASLTRPLQPPDNLVVNAMDLTVALLRRVPDGTDPLSNCFWSTSLFLGDKWVLR